MSREKIRAVIQILPIVIGAILCFLILVSNINQAIVHSAPAKPDIARIIETFKKHGITLREAKYYKVIQR